MGEEREIDQSLGSELRQSAGREWVEEAAEDEKLTELLRRRRMSLGDNAREMVERGLRVRVETGPQTFTGQVVFAGSDYAVVERSDDLVAVRLDSAIWILEHREGEGNQQFGGAVTMAAHLSELASTEETIRLVLDDGRALVGSISVVAAEHLEVTQDATLVLVPLRQLVAVIRPLPRF